jgi:multidrug resistance efflux pump
MNNIISSVVVAFLISGCTTTTDPRKGGLFSYNPKAYEVRLDKRKSELHTIEKNTNIQKIESQNLESKLSQNKKRFRDLTEDINHLNVNLTFLQKRVEKSKVSTKRADSKREAILIKLKEVKQKVANLKSGKFKNQNITQKEKRLSKLQNEFDSLMEEAELLSQL